MNDESHEANENNDEVIVEVEFDSDDHEPSSDQESGIVRVEDMLPLDLPILPVWPRPFFPGLPVPLVIEEPNDVALLKRVLEHGPPAIGLVLMRERDGGRKPANMYEVGVAAQILRVINQTEKSLNLLVHCVSRFSIDHFIKNDEKTLVGHVIYHHKEKVEADQELQAYAMGIMSSLKELVKLHPLHGETLRMFLDRSTMDDPGRLADISVNLTSASGEELQDVLETFDVRQRIDKALELLKKECEISRLQAKISKQIEEKVASQQREFFLREQLKAIKKELGLEKEGKVSEIEKFQERLKDLTLTDEASRVVEEEMDKLKVIEPASPEYNVSRTYLDWLTMLPWGKFSKDRFGMKRARKILDRDHYGLEDVKKRILEFMAVGKLRGDVSGSILCLVGPPGVGKTSIGKSVAEALGRTFFRFSLGGMRDEAEIKGHRRTYIGAMPGKFLQAIKGAGTNNPVIMLDEIDKIGKSFQGDPASALLEVLDPEQNDSFRDHYLDVAFDLSQVLFIATANQLDTIPGPLLDRMEVIRLSGYILEEKVEIAHRYLWPKALDSTGLKRAQARLSKKTLEPIIDDYAREAGVRGLEKQLKKIARGVAVRVAEGDTTAVTVRDKDLFSYLGKPNFQKDDTEDQTPGSVTGLAWTSMGGATLRIEAGSVMTKSKGFKQTGQLGDVMKESSEIAYTYAMSRAADFGIEEGFFDNHFVHLHVPAGATPKDGPSAGITMATALISQITKRAVKPGIAMTGELTLIGKVLPIGGVKEKVIAAKRIGRHHLIFPHDNENDFLELPDYLKEGLRVHFVKHYDEVYQICFGEENAS